MAHFRQKRKGGPWQFTVDLPRLADGKRRQVTRSGYKKRKDAEKACAQLLMESNSHPFSISEDITVGDYLDSWFKGHSLLRGLSYKATKRYEQIIRIYLKPHLGRFRLKDLKTMNISGFYALAQSRKPQGLGVSAHTLLYCHRILFMALKHAVNSDVLHKNPILGIPAPRLPRRQPEVLTVREAEHLMKQAEDMPIGLPIKVALLTGMREGEICGLRWRDVDFEQRILHVRHALQRIDGALVLKEPKTRTSVRSIFMSNALTEALRRALESQRSNRQMMGRSEDMEYEFVCCWPDGRPLDPDYVSKSFRALVKRLWPRRIRFHDLRHSFITHLAQADVHPKVASALVGHASDRMTNNVYTHALPVMLQNAAARIDGLYGGGKAPPGSQDELEKQAP